MHNLKLLNITCLDNLDWSTEADLKLCTSPATQQIYVASVHGLYSLNDAVDSCSAGALAGATQIFSWNDADVSTTGIVSCDVIDMNVCITTVEGDVLLYNTEDMEVEVVGSVSDGISAACWSPDQELLVLVTTKHNAMMLNSQFLTVSEFCLHDQQFGEALHVNLGWGKKETQFHGSEGKQAAKSSKEVAIKTSLNEADDGLPRVSWRGDGQMFVISYVDNDTSCRRLRIANRSGVLQSTSEAHSRHEQSLSWKPSGSVIASTERLPNKYNVIFFEKNGLRHGEFTLPERKNFHVKEVMWNIDSTVLMVWFQPSILTGEKTNESCKDEAELHHVQLWTVNNYTWYLKEEVTLRNVKQVMWDCEQPLKMYFVRTEGISTYRWSFCVNKSCGVADDDLALVSVIKGNKLLMTPFKLVKIPPPMCAYEVIFPEQINSVFFPSFSNTTQISDSNVATKCCLNSNSVCVQHSHRLTVLSSLTDLQDLDAFGCKVDYRLNRSPHFKVMFPVHKILTQFDLTEINKDLFDGSRLLHCIWLTEDFIYGICYNTNSFKECIVSLDIRNTEVKVKVFSANIGSIISTASLNNVIFFQNNEGEIFQLEHGQESLSPVLDEQGIPVVFASMCPQMTAALVEGETILFGLSTRNRLYIGNKQLLGNCSSFVVYTDHLLLTTTSHKLLMIPMKIGVLAATVDSNLSGVAERNVERGSKLVTAVPTDCEVVQQMPRGNIETIYPRPLLVHILQKLLEKRQYHKSLELMRKHRVDMNLLYDHSPQDFHSNCSQIVESVNNAGWMDLFIASLKNEDVTQTLYAFNYINVLRNQLTTDNAGQSKVDRICIAIRESMINIDEDKYLLPILSSYVKMDTSEMDEALKKVKSIKDGKKGTFEITADEGLRHLLYIADANVLCDVALGTYDFDLVMMVFEKSQKDPKEFLPFLNNLRVMEEHYMKYNINVYLKRFRKALECIKHTGSKHLEECLTLVKKEKMFSVALEEFIPGTALYNAVAEAYGDYNLGKGYYGEAGLLYERAGQKQESLEAFKQQGSWRKVFILAAQLNYSRSEMSDLYASTIEVLKEKKMFAEAAVIYKDYLNNYEDTVECLTLAHSWDDAIRVSYQCGRLDLIETNVQPELLKQFTSTENEIEDMSATFTAFCSRLVLVRENMEKEHQNMLDGTGEVQLDGDMYCDTSTVTGMSHSRGSRSHTGTNVSGRTYRSAKNRKKLERKKHSTREGSSFEDLGLITELHSTMVRADALAEPVGQIVSTLYSFSKDDKAARLQTSLHNLFRLMESKEKVIWPVVDITETEESQQVYGAHMSTTEMIMARQGVTVTGVGHGGESSRHFKRMMELPSTHRQAPKPLRPANWALGFLQKKNKS